MQRPDVPNHSSTPVITGKLLAILDAAKRAIVRDGLNNINIDAIAADAGVSRQTVYNKLGDKEQLVVAVIRDVTARTSVALMAAVET
jgi:AcrR family transcriptional regulator